MDTRPTRRRSASVTLGVSLALAATLSGCGQEEYTHGAVCADRETQERVEDEQCDDERRGGRHGWYFIPVGGVARPVGTRVGGGTFTAPPASQPVYRGGVPRGGGAVSRGGFGGRSGAVGG